MSMTPLNPPRTQHAAAVEKVTPDRAMTYLGFTLIFLVVAPPVAVILWRIAVGPW